MKACLSDYLFLSGGPDGIYAVICTFALFHIDRKINCDIKWLHIIDWRNYFAAQLITGYVGGLGFHLCTFTRCTNITKSCNITRYMLSFSSACANFSIALAYIQPRLSWIDFVRLVVPVAIGTECFVVSMQLPYEVAELYLYALSIPAALVGITLHRTSFQLLTVLAITNMMLFLVRPMFFPSVNAVAWLHWIIVAYCASYWWATFTLVDHTKGYRVRFARMLL